MKMTLVVDTDDIKGLEASHKMITTLCRQYDTRIDSRGMDKRFSKIAFIKALRSYMKTQQAVSYTHLTLPTILRV